MEERGILSREARREKRVDWRGSKLVGERICWSSVPKGVPQLPRPAIIRLSGVTISVNVPDSEPRNPSKEFQLAEGIARRVRPPIYRHHSRRRHREILSVTPWPEDQMRIQLYSPFDPVCYLDY